MRALLALLVLAAAMAVGGCNSTASPSPTVAPVTIGRARRWPR